MQAAITDQRRLLDLAAIDTAIAQARHRRETLPVLAAIKELAAERAVVADELTAAEVRLSDALVDQERIEADLEPARARLVRNQTRVDAGEIGDPKALQGMVEEIEHLKGRIVKLEDDELDVMQTVEDLTSERDAIAARKAEIETNGRELVAQRNTSLAEIDAQISALTSERDQTAVGLAAELIDLYDKVRTRIGSGAASLSQGRCTGCQLEANAADLRRYTSAAPTEVLRCEECGRILVRLD